MTLATNAAQRQVWLSHAHRIVREIEDLRLEISAAMQMPPTLDTIRLLSDADIHLHVAQLELNEASIHIQRIL